MNFCGSNSGCIFSRAPGGSNSDSSMNSHFKILSRKLLGIGGSPSPTQTLVDLPFFLLLVELDSLLTLMQLLMHCPLQMPH